MKYLINFLKGMAIGIATLVPGVSGGTMAVILGIYDDLIHAVSSFFENWRKHTLILLEIGIGSITGILLFSKLLENIIVKHPFVMRFFFIGVIIGGLPILHKKSISGKRNFKDLIFLVMGLLIVIVMSSESAAITSLATSESILGIFFLFIAGSIIAIALILPGISASFMLFVLGLYNVVLNAINTRNIIFLVPLGLGIILGTLGTAKAIENLLQKYPSKTYMLILGFVIGSLLPVFPGVPEGFSIITSMLAFIIGFMIIQWLARKEIN